MELSSALEINSVGGFMDNTGRESSENLISCTSCNFKFHSKIDLVMHMKVSHKVSAYKCNKCNISFQDKLELNDHQAIHEISDTSNVSCDKCSMKFVSLHYLNCHIRDVHGDKRFSCNICSREFRALRYLKEHKSKIHSGKEKPKCPICEKEFRGKGELKTHLVIHTGERPYECKICSKTFRARSNFDVHMKIHNGIKNFVCEICNRAFTVKNDLKRHLTTHAGTKAFECQECGKRFNRKFQLEKHNLVIHGKSKKKEIQLDASHDLNLLPALDLELEGTDIIQTQSGSIEANTVIESVNGSVDQIGEHFVMVLAPNNNNHLMIHGDVLKSTSGDDATVEIESRMFVLDNSCNITLSSNQENGALTLDSHAPQGSLSLTFDTGTEESTEMDLRPCTRDSPNLSLTSSSTDTSLDPRCTASDQITLNADPSGDNHLSLVPGSEDHHGITLTTSSATNVQLALSARSEREADSLGIFVDHPGVEEDIELYSSNGFDHSYQEAGCSY